jgi:hypothetical protein
MPDVSIGNGADDHLQPEDDGSLRRERPGLVGLHAHPQAGGIWASEEPLLSNIYGIAGAQHRPLLVSPTRRGGEEHSLEWLGESGIAPLKRMAVLDTRAMALHLDEDLTFVCTPADLALFNQVYDAIEEVRARAEGAAKERKPGANPFLPRFERGTAVYQEIEALGPTSDVTVLECLAEVPDDVAEIYRVAGRGWRHSGRKRLRPPLSWRATTRSSSLPFWQRATPNRHSTPMVIRALAPSKPSPRRTLFVSPARRCIARSRWCRQKQKRSSAREKTYCGPRKSIPTRATAHCVYCEQALDESGLEVVRARRACVNDQSAVERDRTRRVGHDPGTVCDHGLEVRDVFGHRYGEYMVWHLMLEGQPAPPTTASGRS